MISFRKFFYKSAPYIISFLVGVLIYFSTLVLQGSIRDLLVNVSASLIAITVILISYELVKSISERKLNVEIFEYGKMQIDREILGVVHQLMKLITSPDKLNFSQKGATNFLNMKQSELRLILQKNDFIGFQIFRTWEAYEANIEDILKNPLITEKFENDHIITLIEILKGVREMDDLQKIQGVFVQQKGKLVNSSYKLVKGSKINPANKEYPDRYLLLKNVKGDKFQVLDFPDIPEYRKTESFNFYKINPKIVDHFSLVFLQLIGSINTWLKLTGNEFLIDTKMFKMRPVFKEKCVS